jgi:uncharacterized membrane protein
MTSSFVPPSLADLDRGREATDTQRLVADNVRALVEMRSVHERSKSAEERVADAITSFTGSMTFVYLHAGLVAAWLLMNAGVIPGVRPFDPYPFVLLAMIASVEAIFLSTFVLISQNRMARLADRRADLDVQINLLAEHEVTKVLTIVTALARRVGVPPSELPDVSDLTRDVKPAELIREIEAQERRSTGHAGTPESSRKA